MKISESLAEASKRYSDDRKSLCQELKSGLEARGFFVPSNYFGGDILSAVFMAIDDLVNKNEKALAELVAVIYFADSSKYKGAIWNAIRLMNKTAADLLEKDEHAAYEKYSETLQ